jgi:ribonuclease HI
MQSTMQFISSNASSINTYIDGSCINNGYKNAKAGYAVFFADNDTRNEYRQVEGKQSNNTGELTAFIRCLQILEKEIKYNRSINIYTDSEYVIKCATTYGSKLHAKNWQSKTEVPNLELVKEAYTLFSTAKSVKLHYIEAHTNKDDTHSKGNAEADRLAKLAIGISETKAKPDIIQLDWITFDTKDAAKALGAKWNQKFKVWYVDANTPEETIEYLKKLQTSPPAAKESFSVCEVKKIYIKISYSQKDTAKKLGARWDATMKSWYYVDDDISEENKKKLNALK